MTSAPRHPPRLIASVALLLAACGGGGGDAGTATTQAAAAALTITGTATTGTAVVGGTVEAKCAAGAGSAVTSTSGAYTLEIKEGKLPCALRVRPTSGAALRSLANGGGNSATANLTPLTELVVAKLSGGAPAGYYDGFDATTAAAQTAAATQAATAAVVQVLKEGGVDIGASGDPLTAPIAAGNPQQQALDALNAALAAGQTTLADLGTAVAAPTAASATASLPAAQLLRPSAPTCAALRSGRYRIVINEEGDRNPSTEIVTVDAVKSTVTNADNQVSSLQANGTCRFSNPASGAEVLVTNAGLVVARVASNGPVLKGAILFPEQAHTVAELAGEWNTLAFDRTDDNGPIHLTSSLVALDATGRLTALTACDDLRNCTNLATPPAVTIATNTSGGFDLQGPGWTDRLFAYRAGGGELMLVALSQAGHIMFLTRKAAVAMPAVGRMQERTNLVLTAQYTAPQAMSPSKNTVASVDTANNSYVRNNVQNFSTGATRPETVVINSLRDGYQRRLPATGVPLSDGSGTGNVSEYFALVLRGMDLSVLALPSANQLQLSAQVGQ